MQLSVYMALSANGLISNEQNNPYWLSPEFGQGFMEICQQKQAVIMGRLTYDILNPDHLPLNNEGTMMVLTHGQHASSNKAVVFTGKPPADIVRDLEARGHTEAVIIGGTATVSAFAQAGLINDFYFVVEPFLFGGGLPLLQNVSAELPLQLLDVKKLNGNTVRLHYRVQQP